MIVAIGKMRLFEYDLFGGKAEGWILSFNLVKERTLFIFSRSFYQFIIIKTKSENEDSSYKGSSPISEFG